MLWLVFRWLILGLLSVSLGNFIVSYLTSHPLRMSLYLTLGWISLTGMVSLLAITFRGWWLGAAAIASLALLTCGYWTAAKRVLERDDPRGVPDRLRSPGDPGEGHTAVIYFTHGEPQTYDPIGWINQFREFDEQQIRFVPFFVRPLFLHKLRGAYLKVGGSNHRRVHTDMMASLEAAFRRDGDDRLRFYLSFLDDEPRPDAAVIQALNDGASKIILAEVFLTISNHTAEGEHLVDALRVEEQFGVSIKRTGPLWDSALLRRMFVARVNDHLDGADKASTAILLVGHGQPDEWDIEWGTETSQEVAFRQAVLDLLVDDGFSPELVGLAWMEFKSPKPAECVETFASRGAKRVLYFSAAISADSIHSQFDVPKLIDEAVVPAGIERINLGAWNNDPLVIQAIKERIEEQMTP
ncbi:ferrochelatase [Candidatus Bipolaricaulota bacterium]|nr:ferrochelatase [Candidatus Bipolaricaulota bacterium]